MCSDSSQLPWPRARPQLARRDHPGPPPPVPDARVPSGSSPAATGPQLPASPPLAGTWMSVMNQPLGVSSTLHTPCRPRCFTKSVSVSHCVEFMWMWCLSWMYSLYTTCAAMREWGCLRGRAPRVARLRRGSGRGGMHSTGACAGAPVGSGALASSAAEQWRLPSHARRGCRQPRGRRRHPPRARANGAPAHARRMWSRKASSNSSLKPPTTLAALSPKTSICRRWPSLIWWHLNPFSSRHCFWQSWQYHRSF